MNPPTRKNGTSRHRASRAGWHLTACMLSAVILSAGSASADHSIPLANRGQEKSNWCWAGCSEMLLDHYVGDVAQTSIASYGTMGYNLTNGMSRTNVVSVIVPEVDPRRPTLVTKNGIKVILKNWGLESEVVQSRLTQAEVVEQIDLDSAFIIREGWYDRVSKADQGGHFIVCHGYLDSGARLQIQDPWPADDSPSPGKAGQSAIVSYDTVSGDSVFTYQYALRGNATALLSGNAWTHTLTIAKAMDLVFLIDSTGSMGDDIAAVKTQATNLLNSLSAKFRDLRVGVADYRDYPVDPYGDSGDYLFNKRVELTSDMNAARSAINAITTGGGNDWPEGVYSAVSGALTGFSWRSGEFVQRKIVLLGDAPPHDPEPWTGGLSYRDVVKLATNPDLPIAVHSMIIGFDSIARDSLGAIASESGGSSGFANGSSDLVTQLNNLFDQISASREIPVGEYAGAYPEFVLEPSGAGMNSEGGNGRALIQTYRFDSKKSSYVPHKLISSKSRKRVKEKSSWKKNSYRWRTGHSSPAAKSILPSGVKITTPSEKSFDEGGWNDFVRADASPGDVTILFPTSSFMADGSVRPYFWGSSLRATKYVLEIFQNGKFWKRLYVTPPSSNPDAAWLQAVVSGHKVGYSYYWRVQGLNVDRPKIDPSAWTYAF